MKNFLEYYYNLINITVHEVNKMYYFYYHNNLYTFISTRRPLEEIIAIFKTIGNDSLYNNIILNRNNSPITYYNNKGYVLIKVKYKNDNLKEYIYNKNNVVVNKDNEILLRNNWYLLITKKIDYLEYQRNHLEDKYKILSSSLDYYIGMSENAIEYYNDSVRSTRKTEEDNLVIAHKRITSINKNDYYNPLNIVIDHPTRDISEYLKYLFINDTYNINDLKNVFNSINLSEYGYRMLYSRMLYPSFYFDIYEKIINDHKKEEDIIKIIKRSSEYEEYLNTIFNLINNKIKIPNIDWI